ncbi:MAG TPA: AbrB/MazE/SpoVT family DNA-binding domain-containing protein [Thermoanaerobaculia bacterium]|nr:AbrB/MazE/SpoVT family DNA-binding domain-containing protein [Thermoanaerobaculia bacterium]
MMPTATLSSKGQITLPKAVRDVLRVDAGDQVDFVISEQGKVTLRPVTIDITELRGMLMRPGRRSVSVEEMDAAILRQHLRKR